MIRIRLILPKRQEASYRNLDILHDALVNAWVRTGCAVEKVLGPAALPWNFAALGWSNSHQKRVHTLVVSTPDPELTSHLRSISPADVAYARARTAESVTFERAAIKIEPDPIAHGQTAIGAVMLSPLAISRRAKDRNAHRWHSDLDGVDLSEAVNLRLSRLAGRDVRLAMQPDRLYLRTRERHDVVVQTKEDPKGKKVFVIGMVAPLVIRGSEDDLRLVWYCGIGEKTRSGFGCIGLAEKGVGR